MVETVLKTVLKMVLKMMCDAEEEVEALTQLQQ